MSGQMSLSFLLGTKGALMYIPCKYGTFLRDLEIYRNVFFCLLKSKMLMLNYISSKKVVVAPGSDCIIPSYFLKYVLTSVVVSAGYIDLI